MIAAACGEEMAKTVKIGKALFESILSKMIGAKPLAFNGTAKSKKNLLGTRKKAA
jgi:hypothetical protein